MKIRKMYEVWHGGDMVDDMLDLQTALQLAKEELSKPDHTDVVIDQIIHWEVENFDDIESLAV
jgi:hypothetical protein